MASSKEHKKKSPFGQLLDAVAAEYVKIGQWNEHLQRDLPKKWEKHGDMVLLPENAFTLAEWRMLGRNLWKVVAQCLQAERVGRKRRIEKDDYRSPHIELLFGQHGWVVHVDNGISYHYDVTKCMFSIGNINEKLRIANFDCKNEAVVDMFAGIGYFTLPYLVHAKAQIVHACEWNPDAIEALIKNLTANKVDDRCVVHEGDCRKVCPVGVADRVNLGLLPTARAYWLTACKALKPTGGILHVHENVTSAKLKKSMSRQESTISNSDIIVGDSITIKYCYDEEEDQEGVLQNGKANGLNGPDTRKEKTPEKQLVNEKSEIRQQVKKQQNPENGHVTKEEDAGKLKMTENVKNAVTPEKIKKDGTAENDKGSGKSKKAGTPEKGKKEDSPLESVRKVSRDSKSATPPPASSDTNTQSAQHAQMIRRDSLFEELDFYEPPVHESFQADWTSSNLDGSWKQFSVAAARRMRRFLNNLHDAEWDVSIVRVGKIKAYAPRIDHIVLDLECRPLKSEGGVK